MLATIYSLFLQNSVKNMNYLIIFIVYNWLMNTKKVDVNEWGGG